MKATDLLTILWGIAKKQDKMKICSEPSFNKAQVLKIEMEYINKFAFKIKKTVEMQHR